MKETKRMHAITSLTAAGALVALAALNPAAAAPITGGFGFATTGSVVLDTPNIATATSTATYPGAKVNLAGSGDLASIVSGDTVTVPVFPFAPGTGSMAASFTVSADGWVFSFSDEETVARVATSATGGGALGATYTGTVTVSPIAADVGAPVELSLSLDQPRIGAPINGSNTAVIRAIEVPEPASLALLGGALFGLGFLRRRRA